MNAVPGVITRHEEQGDSRLSEVDPRGKLLASHSGHNHVAQHQVDLTRPGLEQLQGLDAVSGHRHAISRALDDPGRGFAQLGVVLDK